MWKLLQFLWLSVEVVFDTGSVLSHQLEFIGYGFGLFAGDALYMAVALNRLHFVVRPGSSMKFWTSRYASSSGHGCEYIFSLLRFRHTTILAVVCLVAGFLYDMICAFVFDVPDDAFIGHLPSMYSFGLASRDKPCLVYLRSVLYANLFTVAISLLAYAIIFAYSLFKRFLGKLDFKSLKLTERLRWLEGVSNEYVEVGRDSSDNHVLTQFPPVYAVDSSLHCQAATLRVVLHLADGAGHR